MKKFLLILFLVEKFANSIFDSVKIFDGFTLSIERAPYYVQLIVWEGFLRDFRCGGSILASRLILTAGHCLDQPDIPLSSYFIIVGSDKRLHGDLHVIESIKYHPQYHDFDGYCVVNDVALIILEEKLIYSTQIQPILIPDKMTEPLAAGVLILSIGLGWVDNWTPPMFLKAIYLPVLSEMECSHFTAKCSSSYSETQLCARNLSVVGHVPCMGDSGSPAIYNGRQYGLTSWLDNCTNPGFPQLFANLITLNGWIREYSLSLGFRLP